ncbi:dynein axonemal assembly factor 3 homolog [Anopheles maculipalpis]|uniref:dynein axonemal assembly factor 3 homolog n=1 Tax=Anopheles maculipalpis TaxID=1496333 RepID=UPI002158E400|nr:dynein axonemal assembly factor 3 homolog [Anopheles maculipalpis]
MFWGFCEALNFLQEYKKISPADGPLPDRLDILLFGSGDPRHILATAAQLFLHPGVKVNLYLAEGCIELLARHMVLVAIALEDPQLLSLKGKTHLFMDIYGNSLVRPFSSAYLSSKAKELIKIITDPEYAHRQTPIFNYTALRYKERDQLADVFRFWTNAPEHVFNVARYWDDRLRAQLGVRYDHRDGAFDWDLQMKLRPNGATQICPQEYKHWRETGVGFTFPEYEQSDPNKTFAVGLVRNGKGFLHRGSVGDNMTGPYIGFGQRCAEERLTRSKHGVNDFRSTDVTERNVLQVMYEIQERVPYCFDLKDIHQFGSHQLDTGKNLNKHEARSEPVEAVQYNKPLLPCENLTVHLLSVEDVLRMQDLDRFGAKFDAVFVASNYFSLLKDGFNRMWKDICLVCFETRQLTVFSNEEIEEHIAQIKAYAQKQSLTPVTNVSINKTHSVLFYKHQGV